MKNILKVWLKKNQLTTDPTEFNAQVAVKGNIVLSDIVDELIKEGLEMNRDTMIDIIARFNRKSADLALSGYNVNNGLVNMHSSIKGPLYDGKWNPNVNWVDVAISHGNDLYQAVANTSVDILGEKEVQPETFNLSNQSTQLSVSSLNSVRNEDSVPHHKIVAEPACGIAFRRWLCKA